MSVLQGRGLRSSTAGLRGCDRLARLETRRRRGDARGRGERRLPDGRVSRFEGRDGWCRRGDGGGGGGARASHAGSGGGGQWRFARGEERGAAGVPRVSGRGTRARHAHLAGPSPLPPPRRSLARRAMSRGPRLRVLAARPERPPPLALFAAGAATPSRRLSRIFFGAPATRKRPAE